MCSFLHRLVEEAPESEESGETITGQVVEEPSRWREHTCSAPGVAMCGAHSGNGGVSQDESGQGF